MAGTIFKVRRATAADWTSVNPVLRLGEPGYETDTRNLKFGDGSTAWNSLAYIAAGYDDEQARDAIGTALQGTANEITVTVNDGADTITLSLPAALTFTGKTTTGGAFVGLTSLMVGTSAALAVPAPVEINGAVNIGAENRVRFWNAANSNFGVVYCPSAGDIRQENGAGEACDWKRSTDVSVLAVGGPVKPKSYTVATVPSAANAGAGAMIYVSDESGGAVIAFSDGSDWRRCTDRAVVS